MKNILVIVYKFPPMGGIGTRRWAKFSKYLVEKGYTVHILTCSYPYEDKVNWLNDVNNKNIILHNFKSKYPSWLLVKSKINYINKVKRFLQYFLYKTFFYIDNAQYDAKNLLSEAKKIISKYNIKNVIASGHPVSINYISTYLKIDLPNINLIQDYRDNWNDLNIYQFGNKSGMSTFHKKEKIALQEFFTLNYSDLIINVSDDLTKSLQRKHSNIKEKMITITNGFDQDDFSMIKNTTNDSFTIIYAGSLYNHRIEAIYLILDAIIDLNDEYINDNFKIIIYSNYEKSRINTKYNKYIDKNLFFNESVSPNEIMEIIASNKYCLSINSKFASYAFGTKIFDYMALNKKIFHISNGGVLYDILKDKKQFVSIYTLEEIKKTLILIKLDYQQNINDELVEYDEYSIKKLTNKLVEYLV